MGSDAGLEVDDEDPLAPAAQDLAASLGLVPVGWLFTDLEAEDLSAGTVKYKRYIG